MDKLKLMIIDDEEGIIDYVQRYYKDKGFVTFGATDGIKAVEIYEKERPDIILVDVHMPYSPINGIETFRRIKAINKDVICIMISRITEKDKIEEARELGALHYVIKPVTIPEMDASVEDALEILRKRGVK